MDWISIKDKKPIPKDSPILATETLVYFCTKALHYINGWDGPGWYDSSDEYGMGLEDGEAHFNEYRGIKYWMPLPKQPEEYKENND